MENTTLWLSRWPPSLGQATNNPFLTSGFLNALEEADVCCEETGWQPSHLQTSSNIYVPAYVKSHSWGEYVFDWAWANAYEQYGFQYYPKLVTAIPFTPSRGPRFLGARNQQDIDDAILQMNKMVEQQSLSGFHILFPSKQESEWLKQCNLLERSDVQYHWQNRDYRDFNDYLSRFSSRKRKNVRKERESIAQQGLTIRRLTGNEIDETSWLAFYRFYHATYIKRGRQGYLNRDFFDRVIASLREHLMLVMAYKDNNPIASALFFKDNQTLYGRYWGCFEEFNNLHFEACYYQGIEYCIEQGLTHFDPGTQGEHKISRGFEPTLTHSYHWLRNPQFYEAARQFCREEKRMNERYILEARRALPFKEEK